MTDTRTLLRKYADAGRPLVEQSLGLADEFAALRDAARNDGIDWISVKKLLKAQILDERDGTDKRVTAIIEKADFACAYADMLGIATKVTENKITRDDLPTVQPSSNTAVGISNAPAIPSSLSIPDDGSIPEFLRRSA